MVTRREVLKLGVVAGLSLLPEFLSQSGRPSLPTTLHVVSREEWRAGEPDLQAAAEHGLYDPQTNPGGWLIYDAPLSEVLHTIVVHHTATYIKQHPREIQKWHRKRLGLADIGYHFVINPEGIVCEGRDIGVRGAHTGGHNTGTVGVALFGQFELWRPAEVQIVQLKLLAAYLRDTYAITHLAGHRDFQPAETVCPGRYLADRLPDLAAEVGLAYGIGGEK
ncbi:MAG TPA: peptidoglycan recognition family protein [Anaerolineae bacterium]|nr:peptidoglycan recognition family protein [Anaerolineae bacterium]